MTDGTATVSVASRKARDPDSADATRVGSSDDQMDETAVVTGAYRDTSKRTDGNRKPSLRLCENVWTVRPITVDRGTSTASTETRDQGVSVCVEDEIFDDKHDTLGLQGGHQGSAPASSVLPPSDSTDSHFGGLETIADRLGPMLFQNLDTEAYADFITYNDPVDDHKPTHGSLLPLWDVNIGVPSLPLSSLPAGQTLDVTSMSWHPTNPNMFAVSLGCLEVHSNDGNSVGGMICVYSVRDLQVPRAQITLDVGVMSVAFGPRGLDGEIGLAGGLADGGLVVIGFGNGSRGYKNPTIVRSRIDHNHLFAVWNVRWGNENNTSIPDAMDPVDPVDKVNTVDTMDASHDAAYETVRSRRGEMTITTTSHDGLEGHWHVPREILLHSTHTNRVIHKILRVGSTIINQPDSTHPYDPTTFLPAATLAAAGLFHLKMVCCRFSSETTHATNARNASEGRLSVVAHGTLEGDVGINGAWYQHHTAPVHAVQTNPFDPHYVMAASLDGSLSFWMASTTSTTSTTSMTSLSPPTAITDENYKTKSNISSHTPLSPATSPDSVRMLLDVDVGEPIFDAQWSTQSSTICAAATENGNVCVFDLSISKEVPICAQHVSNTPLTCIRFMPLPSSNHQNRSPSNACNALLAVGTADGRLLWLKLSPNLRIAKNATENDGNEDYWGTDDSDTGILSLSQDRELCDPHAQLEHLHRAFSLLL